MQRASIAGQSSLAAASALYMGSDSSDNDDEVDGRGGRRSASPPQSERLVKELSTTDTSAVLDGLEAGMEYRIVIIPSNHYGEQCPGNHAEIVVRTEGPQAPWK